MGTTAKNLPNGKIILKETLTLCTHIMSPDSKEIQIASEPYLEMVEIVDQTGIKYKCISVGMLSGCSYQIWKSFFVSLTARHTTTLPNPESWRCIRVAEQNPSRHSHAEINSKRIIHRKSTRFICATKTAHTDGYHPT